MKKDYFKFLGEGGDLFLIYLKNFFLCLFSLGLYLPWAIVNITKYTYSNIEFKEKRFNYTGSGKEIFKGFIKGFLLIILVAIFIGLISSLGYPSLSVLAMLLVYIGFFVLLPFIWHSALKYDMANTTYNQIRFGYRGDRETLIKLFLKNVFLTIITLGIYGSWMEVNLQRYILKNTRLGSVQFSFFGEGVELFLIHLKGIIFTIFSLGIYSFWWMNNVFNYWVENIRMVHEEQEYSLKSNVTGGKIFMLFFTNMLLIAFTFGFGIAWADVRTLRFICENCYMDQEVNVESIKQTEPEYNFGDGVGVLESLDIQ